MTRSLAITYADRNIRVNCICPGLTHSGMVKRSLHQSCENCPLSVPEPELLLRRLCPGVSLPPGEAEEDRFGTLRRQARPGEEEALFKGTAFQSRVI